jgi:predicted restriction endonuclease
VISREDQLLERIFTMGVHGGSRNPAPHKALLVALVASIRAAHPEQPRLVPYSKIKGPMKDLLILAGRSPRPWYPFVRLANDTFWELSHSLELNSSGDIARPSELNRLDVAGGFRDEFDTVVRTERSARRIIDTTCDRWLEPQLAAAVRERLFPSPGVASP